MMKLESDRKSPEVGKSRACPRVPSRLTDVKVFVMFPNAVFLPVSKHFPPVLTSDALLRTIADLSN